MENQPKNHIFSVFFLVVVVVFILAGLKVSENVAHAVYMTPINLFSQIEYQDTVSTLPSPETEKQPASTPSNIPDITTGNDQLGIIKFNDYSKNKDGLHPFFRKLLNIKKLNKPVRIAYYGDSFIEGDILSGDLRFLFQKNFGGKGVGMMPVTSQVNGFRRTVIHQFSAWNTYTFNDYDKSKLGIAGNMCIPNQNAWVYYQGAKKNCLDTFERVSVFYTLPNNDTRVFYKKDKGTSIYAKLPKNDSIGRINIDGNCNNIQISFPPIDNLQVYGVSLEDTTGVILDNYSIRGFSGTGLQSLSQKKLSQFNNLLQYDLIILEYGLNITEAKRKDYTAYETEMVKTINHLKLSFPNASILLVGVSDRSYKENNDYKTMPGILSMVEYQKNICQKTGIVFWNLFEAMGGKNSMPLFVNSIPPKANKDYTHLTFAGGEYLGNLLYETFMYEKKIFEKKNPHAMLK